MIPEEATKCTWCGRDLTPLEEVASLGAQFKSGKREDFEAGKFIELQILNSNRRVNAFVTPLDSDAKRDGIDLMFALCSQECADSLQTALERDTDSFAAISSN